MTPAGLPHSETLGSKFGYQLPEAYRRFLRPSSVPGAQASTVCPYTLDHKDARVHCTVLKTPPTPPKTHPTNKGQAQKAPDKKPTTTPPPTRQEHSSRSLTTQQRTTPPLLHHTTHTPHHTARDTDRHHTKNETLRPMFHPRAHPTHGPPPTTTAGDQPLKHQGVTSSLVRR